MIGSVCECPAAANSVEGFVMCADMLGQTAGGSGVAGYHGIVFVCTAYKGRWVSRTALLCD